MKSTPIQPPRYRPSWRSGVPRSTPRHHPAPRFTPSGADPRMSQATPPQSNPSNGSPAGGIDNLTNNAKAKAKAYLDNGRRCLDQKDLPGAIGWYHKSLATGAAFAPAEYSPAALATQLRQAGVAPNNWCPPRSDRLLLSRRGRAIWPPTPWIVCRPLVPHPAGRPFRSWIVPTARLVGRTAHPPQTGKPRRCG